MSRFYATVSSERSENTKAGHQYIEAHVSGWDIGVSSTVRPSCRDQTVDVVSVCITGGSNSPGCKLCLGTFAIKADGSVIKIT